jgi:hypothetical protein
MSTSNHDCEQRETIRKMEIDLAVAKSDINNVKNEITDINKNIESIHGKFDRMLWFILATLAATLGQILFDLIMK